MNQDKGISLYPEPIEKEICNQIVYCEPELVIDSKKQVILWICHDPAWMWRCYVVDVVAMFRVCEVLLRRRAEDGIDSNLIFRAFSDSYEFLDKGHALDYLFGFIDKQTYNEIIAKPIPEALRPHAASLPRVKASLWL